MSRVIRLIFILFLALLFIGCTLANRSKWKQGRVAYEQKAEKEVFSEGFGDAYLFDIKVTDKGRKNSARLDLYWNPEKLGIYARGYFGKGVLKGLITNDTVLAYFPTNNEFYRGRIEEILSNDCLYGFPFEKIIVDIFGITPDKIEYSFGEVYLTIIEEKPGRRKYRLVSQNCTESEYVELDYDWQNGQFVLNQFDYVNEREQFRLNAKRRKFRLNVSLPEEKFQIDIPASAQRIYR